MKERQPQIILGWGASPADQRAADRMRSKIQPYGDLSTVMVIPTRGLIPARVMDSFMSLVRPPNSPTTHITVAEAEVGAAYNWAIQSILDHPHLSKWKFVLTLEEDNLVPPDALLALQKEMVRGKWDVLGGLYWTKGHEGVPQIWGDPTDPTFNFRPIAPVPGKVVRTNGTGMGCTLFRIDVFRHLPGPWFVTQDEGGVFTQDLYAFNRWHEAGVKLKVGVDCRVLVGHLDVETGRVW